MLIDVHLSNFFSIHITSHNKSNEYKHRTWQVDPIVTHPPPTGYCVDGGAPPLMTVGG
jgi:hypothetical protein